MLIVNTAEVYKIFCMPFRYLSYETNLETIKGFNTEFQNIYKVEIH